MNELDTPAIEHSSSEVEMKTIQTNVVPPQIPVFKLLMDTRCVKINNKNRYKYTSAVLKKDEIFWGNIFVNKNRIYIYITECCKCKPGVEKVCIPVMFDMSGKYMINVCEYNGPIYF